jgi:trehalose 6-phosphate phosphatase
MPTRELITILSELNQYLLRIAIISGRDTDALVARLPIDGLAFVCNHGLEERNRTSRLVPEAMPYTAPLERAAAAIARLPREPGVNLERKRAGVSVHFRNAPDPAQTATSLRPVLERIAVREGLQLRAGRMVWELRPPLDINKGEVLRGLVGALRPEAIIYIGDDVTDADAFAALKAMSDTKTLAVGVRSEEVPSATFADCDLIIEGVAGTSQFLGELRDLNHPA